MSPQVSQGGVEGTQEAAGVKQRWSLGKGKRNQNSCHVLSSCHLESSRAQEGRKDCQALPHETLQPGREQGLGFFMSHSHCHTCWTSNRVWHMVPHTSRHNWTLFTCPRCPPTGHLLDKHTPDGEVAGQSHSPWAVSCRAEVWGPPPLLSGSLSHVVLHPHLSSLVQNPSFLPDRITSWYNYLTRNFHLSGRIGSQEHFRRQLKVRERMLEKKTSNSFIHPTQ